jgi:hypothetical protein
VNQTAVTPRRVGRRGQVLPMFALFLIVLFGMAALAIDVSGALSARRFYRSAADAAALAGGQDLQQGSSRTVTGAERTNARRDAMARLVSLLAASSTPGCSPAADIIDCVLPGTPYHVSIKTPSPNCVTCAPQRSIQVTVRNTTYPLTFGRLFGQSTWNVATTSVAGLTFNKAYTIQTLRPPKKLGSSFDIKDITISGTGTTVTVITGDVGSNSNMEYSGTGAQLVLNPDYNMFYYPGTPPSGPLWGTNPSAQVLPGLMTDPNYRYPDMTGAPVYSDARTSEADLPSTGTPPSRPVTRASTDPTCATEAAKLDPTKYTFMATQSPDTIFCFNPGIYQTVSGPSRAQIVLGTGEVGLLKPGAYYLTEGMDISGRIIGGYEENSPGVALMFDECSTSACIFSGNNALTISLNAGTKWPPGSAGNPAKAAIDWAGLKVETSGPDSPNPPLPLTLLVIKDPSCFVPTSAPFIEPSACDANHDKTINIAGGGSLALEGVQYLPTDNVEISGGSTGTGHVGQIISWTLKYSGGTLINQEGPGSNGPGILRLDAACTAPSTPCVNP